MPYTQLDTALRCYDAVFRQRDDYLMMPPHAMIRHADDYFRQRRFI